MEQRYSIPSHITKALKEHGYSDVQDAMRAEIDAWDNWKRSKGKFYDWDETVNGVRTKGHRRSVHPAKRIADEWSRLIFNDRTEIACEDAGCNDYIADFLERSRFCSRAQRLVSDAFSLGTAAWVLWLDADARDMKVRRFDARMVIPLTWDEDGITECAFVTSVHVDGKRCDQLQMHVLEDGNYVIRTLLFTAKGERMRSDGVLEEFDTKGSIPWFAVFAPIENSLYDMCPLGESVYANAIDQIQAVDLCYDAIINEIDLSKMRIFVSDMLVEYVDHNGKKNARPLPFGRDNTVFRKVASNEDMVQAYAPQLRTAAQVAAYRTAWQTLGDSCGFGLKYFDIDSAGGMKTATEVSSDNSALMRNIRAYESLLQDSVRDIVKAALHCARTFLGESLGDEGLVSVSFDDSIITDTAAEKIQDMAEFSGGIMNAWEYRVKWYGEDEQTARANVPAPAFEGVDLGFGE